MHARVQMSGSFNVDSNGQVELIEEDGLDYAAVTVQLAGGERVPFLFTVKELQAKGPTDGFGGDFVVPSYRGSTFLDPKVRSEPEQATMHRKPARTVTNSVISHAVLEA